MLMSLDCTYRVRLVENKSTDNDRQECNRDSMDAQWIAANRMAESGGNQAQKMQE